MGLFENDHELDNVNHEEAPESATMRLREEELDVSKHRERTGEVAVHKEIIEETQTVNVPVAHEEVVVERRALEARPSDEPIGEEETIRIPVSEERVDVDKRTLVTGEVALHKRVVEETEEVTDTVRKERAEVEVDGHPNVIDEGTYDELR
ncbi:MAG TPA: YsnF/AvaK domain-containing protein [Symbiobacteriaceae bacterium]|nr:YsnF/AvaK domain-containing protein [Symbiobacteriaceae bacterium]